METEAVEKSLDLFDYSYNELVEVLKDRFNAESFRATQLFEWLYRKRMFEIGKMSNISGALREKLAKAFTLPAAEIAERHLSSDGSRKYLFKVDSGDLVEAVMIKQPKRMTLCVSSQVGCAMGCKFCRTATMGLKRNLRTSEILQQVLGVLEDAKNFGDTFQNIVFMGMGEPLHNYDNVTRAVRVLTDPHGFGMSPRKITVSTVGLVPAIKKLTEDKVPLSLAVSLNATTDEIREEIMPINKRFKIKELIAALREFPRKNARSKVTIEYVMLSGVNDSREDMHRLVKLLQNEPVKVNLIPYNENAGLGYKTPSRNWIFAWQEYLNLHGLHSTIRWSKGQDIKAACGQLATASRREARPSSALSLQTSEVLVAISPN